jgi:hypothetical protein
MAHARKQKAAATDEPMGIVISQGSRAEDPPRFSAYVWGPVPDCDECETAEVVGV